MGAMIASDYVQRLSALIEERRARFIAISDRIWEYAEPRYTEKRSAALIAEALEEEGFAVLREAGEVPNALVGIYGSGAPVIAILGEYDALFDLSQAKGSAEKQPLVPGGSGHGCGHNLLGTGALAAAVAVRRYMEEQGLSGTVKYYGCPAEEGGGGKAFMARAGLFGGVDAALTWHPSPVNGVMSSNFLATCQVYYKFKGRSSHAAVSPQLGRSALDAVELMNVGANYLREHLEQETRLHYAVTNTGGISPNVVQPEAEVLYKLRAPQSSQVREMYGRVSDIARGAALMTGTEVEIRFDAASSNFILNTTLEKVMYDNFEKLGVPVFDEEDRKLAEAIRATFSDSERGQRMPSRHEGKAVSDTLEPYKPKSGVNPGSSDVGDVSWLVPTAQCGTACMALGTPFHTWQLVSQGAAPIGHKGMLHAGKVIAATAVQLLLQPELLEEAKKEHEEERGGVPYTTLIPPEARPLPVSKT
ncbi:M20 family metallopeptidase [Paenibacillus doosanensis]|uniref:p-aminobenzoyl-glutamate hydrolase subunit B n=1 Tax=Paenibacillus konkukensis TaxID=2020716 RepID=A0ABY4RT48_9BACL|nr:MULTISPECIES: M20 family metallopeptidase [Paenibacillus]MCS7462082.1 M20 family metallopeptidase [Paenibacillus doosanensis]UQZ85150.1 p-aminobenzoyl-glutamate hydrolase subunit B [Paenibacillus konkukensis]